MIIKQVKEYSNRQRITLNKSDGLKDGQEVVVLPTKEYDFQIRVKDNKISELKETINEKNNQINSLEKEIEKLTIEKNLLQNQQNNLKDIIEDTINPIHKQYKEQLSEKNDTISELKMENKSLKNKSNQLCIDIMDLSALQLIFTNKKKVLIDDFNKSISIVLPNDTTISETNAKQIEDKK